MNNDRIFFLYFSYVFHNGILEPRYDWFHCVVNIPEDAVRVEEPHEGEQMTTLTSGKRILYTGLYDTLNFKVESGVKQRDLK